MPARKRSIHVGVDAVDPHSYPKPLPPLTAAEADAAAMRELAVTAGLDATMFVGRDATREAVLGAWRAAAVDLAAGDLLVFTFSGHGARYRDIVGPAPRARPLGTMNRAPGDDPDGFDECWCLWNGVLVDDDIHAALCDFDRGVRIYVLSDSCYSGTILRRDGDKLRAEVRASVLLSAASAEDRIAETTAARGRFTAAVLAAWDGGRFAGDHLAFHAAIRAGSAPGQVPDLKRYGVPSDAFERARPFGVT